MIRQVYYFLFIFLAIQPTTFHLMGVGPEIKSLKSSDTILHPFLKLKVDAKFVQEKGKNVLAPHASLFLFYCKSRCTNETRL